MILFRTPMMGPSCPIGRIGPIGPIGRIGPISSEQLLINNHPHFSYQNTSLWNPPRKKRNCSGSRKASRC